MILMPQVEYPIVVGPILDGAQGIPQFVGSTRLDIFYGQHCFPFSSVNFRHGWVDSRTLDRRGLSGYSICVEWSGKTKSGST